MYRYCNCSVFQKLHLNFVISLQPTRPQLWVRACFFFLTRNINKCDTLVEKAIDFLESYEELGTLGFVILFNGPLSSSN